MATAAELFEVGSHGSSGRGRPGEQAARWVGGGVGVRRCPGAAERKESVKAKESGGGSGVGAGGA